MAYVIMRLQVTKKQLYIYMAFRVQDWSSEVISSISSTTLRSVAYECNPCKIVAIDYN